MTVVLAVAAFAVVGLFLPQTAHVERSIAIDAPAAMVFTVLDGFRQFNRWSPWADIDPNATTTYAGPETGVGAQMRWAGNAEVGTGSQEILESVPYERLKLRLAFGDFPGDFTASYALAPEGSGTRVTWAFDADYGSSIFGRYFGLMSDAMLGPDYEKGLARLKTFVESLPKGDFSGMAFETAASEARPLLLLNVRSADDTNAVGVALGVAWGRLSGFISAQGLAQAGPAMAIHNGEQGGALSLDAGIPVDRTDVELAAPIRAGQRYEGRVLKAVYTGDYAGLADARAKVRAYLAAAGFEPAGPLWEEYVSDPGATPPAELVTHIYVPIK
ncbi:MAG: SRPBCC family protein [Nevskiaceae bacterium]